MNRALGQQSSRAQRPEPHRPGLPAEPRSQRERLIDATIDLAAREGFQAVSIAHISTHAGVSSATFYEQFNDKEDCALAAYNACAERVLGHMRPIDPQTISTREQWSDAATAALRRVLSAVSANPAAAQILFVESLAGGPKVREQRTVVMHTFQQRAERFLASANNVPMRVDLPAIALVGGIRTIVSRHLRISSEDQLPALAEDLLTWVRSYAVDGTRPAWSTGPKARLAKAPPNHTASQPAPQRLPRGRHRLPPSAVARSHRTRIIHATAQVTMSKGYTDSTVADIVAAASVSRQVFYNHFVDKEHAFLEAQHYPTQHILDQCSVAFFGPRLWHERVWHGLKALLALVVINPALSHLRLVECYAAGPDAIRRAEDITRSFTIFFQEGYGSTPYAAHVPRLASHAIAGAVFEIIQRHVSNGNLEVLPTLLPQLTYIVVAPFTGPAQAVHVLREMTARENQRAGHRTAPG